MNSFWQSVSNQGVKAVMCGSAKFNATGRGKQAVPVKHVAECAMQYAMVISTPEHSTVKRFAGSWKTAGKCGKDGRGIKCRSLNASTRVDGARGRGRLTRARTYAKLVCRRRTQAMSRSLPRGALFQTTMLRVESKCTRNPDELS